MSTDVKRIGKCVNDETAMRLSSALDEARALSDEVDGFAIVLLNKAGDAHVTAVLTPHNALDAILGLGKACEALIKYAKENPEMSSEARELLDKLFDRFKKS